MCTQCELAPTEANIHRLTAERDAARANHLKVMAERDAALGLLKEVEWKGEAGFWEESGCPSCREGETSGHAVDCKLAAALRVA